MKKKKEVVETPIEIDEQLQCMTDSCTCPMRWKGLCSHCYGQAKTLIEANQTTWDELYNLGLALDERPFMIAYHLAKGTAQ